MSLYNDLTAILSPYAEKIKQNEADIANAQESISKIDPVELIPSNDGYLRTDGDTVDITNVYPPGSVGFKYSIVPCVSGDKIKVIGKFAGSVANYYVFVDANYGVLERSANNTSYATYDLTAPDNTAYIIIQKSNSSDNKFWKGTSIDDRIDEAVSDAVKITTQTLSDTEKQTARLNIGAASASDVSLAIKNATTWSVADKFNGIYSGITAINGIISVNSDYKSAIVEMNDGLKYTIKAEGSFNRFGIIVCNDLTAGASAERISYKEGALSYETAEYVNTGNHKYLLVFLAFRYDAFDCSTSITEMTGIIGDTFKVNGVSVELPGSIDQRIADAVSSATPWSVSEMFDGVFTNLYKNTSTNQLAQNANARSAIIQLEDGAEYSISATGSFNRFALYGCEGHTVGSNATTLIFHEGVFTEKECTYVNDGNYSYLLVLLAYNHSNFSAALSIKKTDGTVGDDFTVNGVKVYTADQIGDLSLSGQTGYVSKPDVDNVGTVAELYALYDALVSEYPYSVSKTVLGQGTGNLDIVEYVVTFGNYNSYSTTLRTQDPSIPKPVILILTGCHGYERSSVMGTYQFIRDMVEGNGVLSNIYGNCTLKIIPCGCPYSFDNNGRVNGNGVNIERNFDTSKWTYQGSGTFDYGGSSAGDQPETVIIQNWIDANTDAEYFIDYHNSGYTNEVSFLDGDDSYTGIAGIKREYLESISEIVPRLILKENFASNLIFAYTGSGFNNYSSAYRYSNEKGVLGVCLESSYNQNGSGLHGKKTIKTNAEILGTFVTYKEKQN